MLTDFGKEFRKIRLDRNLTLKDIASKLEVSSAFLSAVENGKQKIPDNFIFKLASLNLFTFLELELLETSIMKTEGFIKINLTELTDLQNKYVELVNETLHFMSTKQLEKQIELLNSVKSNVRNNFVHNISNVQKVLSDYTKLQDEIFAPLTAMRIHFANIMDATNIINKSLEPVIQHQENMKSLLNQTTSSFILNNEDDK